MAQVETRLRAKRLGNDLAVPESAFVVAPAWRAWPERVAPRSGHLPVKRTAAR